MFWWGGWLLNRYPDEFSYKAFLISMFALLFSLYGLAIAAEGAVVRGIELWKNVNVTGCNITL